MSNIYKDAIDKIASTIINETIEEEKLAAEQPQELDPVMAKLASYYAEMEKQANEEEKEEEEKEEDDEKVATKEKCAAYYEQAQAMKEAAIQVLQEAELLEKAALEVFQEIEK